MTGADVFMPIVAAGPDVMAAIMQQSFDPRYGEAWSATQVAGILQLDGIWGEVLIDPEDKTPCAFTLCRFIGDEAELLLIAVTPRKRVSGIGRILTERAAQAARAHGARSMYLEVRACNLAALHLYGRLRFIEVGRRRNYYRGQSGEYFDALTMRKALTE